MHISQSTRAVPCRCGATCRLNARAPGAPRQTLSPEVDPPMETPACSAELHCVNVLDCRHERYSLPCPTGCVMGGISRASGVCEIGHLPYADRRQPGSCRPVDPLARRTEPTVPGVKAALDIDCKMDASAYATVLRSTNPQGATRCMSQSSAEIGVATQEHEFAVDTSCLPMYAMSLQQRKECLGAIGMAVQSVCEDD